MSEFRRRLMMARKAKTYDAEVEYLQSDGAEWIDTGVVFADNFTWEIKFEGGTRSTSIIGARTSNVRTACLYYYSTTEGDYTITIAALTGRTTPFSLGNLHNGVHVVKSKISGNVGNVWLDDVQKYTNQSFSGNYISNVSCAIFAAKYGNNDFREQTSVKVYYFKMWQGDNMVAHFIPVRKDGVGYLYDKVSGQLFGNANSSGSFTYGNDIEPLTTT